MKGEGRPTSADWGAESVNFGGLVDEARRMEGCSSLACAEPIDFCSRSTRVCSAGTLVGTMRPSWRQGH